MKIKYGVFFLSLMLAVSVIWSAGTGGTAVSAQSRGVTPTAQFYTISGDYSQNSGWYTSEVTISAAGCQGFDLVTDDGVNWNPSITLKEGSYKKRFKFKRSSDGAMSAPTASMSFQIDTAKPTIFVTGNQEENLTSGVTLYVMATGGISGRTVTVNGEKLYGNTFRVPANGTYRFVVTTGTGSQAEQTVEVAMLQKVPAITNGTGTATGISGTGAGGGEPSSSGMGAGSGGKSSGSSQNQNQNQNTGSGSESGGAAAATDKENGGAMPEAVATGDESRVSFWLFMLGAAFVLMAVCMPELRYRGKRFQKLYR